MAIKKLNSMRFLEKNAIPYTVFEFDNTIHSAEGVAAAVNVSPDHVFKTLVVLPEDKTAKARPLLVLVSAGRQLDLKALAQVTHLKKLRMATHKEAEQLTGLLVGGISPLALTHKSWPVYINEPISRLEWILLSAGQRGVNLKVETVPLLNVLSAQVIDCTRPD